MKKRMNGKGFSLAELLVVVAIIVVLMGVGFIGLMSHMRNMHQLEVDGYAKEIFVAAQNHLVQAESQGYLSLADKDKVGGGTLGEDAFGTKIAAPAEGPDPGVYYLVVGASAVDGVVNPGNKSSFENSVLSQMLPFGSVEEGTRTKGSYIIRYQKSPAIVLDVFYVSTSGRYSHESFVPGEYDFVMSKVYTVEDGKPVSLDEKTRKKTCRSVDFEGKESGVVLGYYGGAAAADLAKGETLKAPGIVIRNEERLQVVVTNNNNDASINDGKNNLNLLIEGSVSGAKKVIPLVDKDGDLVVDENYLRFTPDSDKAEITVTLDDVTAVGMHFAQLGSDDNSIPFLPGEDLLIHAVSFNNDYITNIAESGVFKTNSLFASLDAVEKADPDDPDTYVASVANFRHFLNLDDGSVSYVGKDANGNAHEKAISLAGAVQISDMSWDDRDDATDSDFVTAVGFSKLALIDDESEASGPSGSYYPISPSYALVYDGKEHKISDVIESTNGSGDAVRDAGLFGALAGGSVSNLELIDFSIETKGNAGALAGVTDGTDISGVLVRNSTGGGDDDYKIKSTGAAAGGLVGKADGGKFEYCAASVYVRAAGSAGGLIGELGKVGSESSGSVIVENSYTGGHTKDAKYLEPTAVAAIVYSECPINVVSTGGSAGGLIGAADSALTLTYSYSTASASSQAAAADTLGVGGLVGRVSVNGTTVNNSYAVGLVYAPNVQAAPFVASIAATVATTSWDKDTNWFLAGVSQVSDSGTGYVSCVSSGQEGVGIILTPAQMEDVKAVVYDKTLLVDWGGKFNYPTIEMLHGSGWTAPSKFINSFTTMHYGDWQVPSMLPLVFTYENKHKLFTEITLGDNTHYLTVGIAGETSGQARMFVLDLWDEDTNAWFASNADIQLVDLKGGEPGTADWSKAVAEADYPKKLIFDFDRTNKKFKLYLDDITVQYGHFAQLCASFSGDEAGRNLQPGENVTLYVGSGKGTWEELITLGAGDEDKGPKEHISSLFADGSGVDTSDAGDSSNGIDGERYTAQIRYIRHLQNLDVSTSNVDALVTRAKVMETVAWSTANYSAIYNCPTDATAPKSISSFNGIYNASLTELDGNNQIIRNLVVNGTTDDEYIDKTANETGSGNAGLFRSVDNTYLKVKDLHLEEPQITSSGNAGAIAAEVSSGKELIVQSCLAESGEEVVTSTGSGKAAGGLVGLSSGTLTVDNSASAMRVSAAGAAGGLVGRTAGATKVFVSYVGGHTAGGEYGSDWNISGGTAAGGIIGEMTSTVAMQNTFSTASVHAPVGMAGGIIGLANGAFSGESFTSVGNGITCSGGALSKVYTLAPVDGVELLTAPSSNGALVGAASTAIANSGNLFWLPNVYAPLYKESGKTAAEVTLLGAG